MSSATAVQANPAPPMPDPLSLAEEVDASKGFWHNRHLFEQIALSLVYPYRQLYLAAGPDQKFEMLSAARDWVAWHMRYYDQHFGWDFPDMADVHEKYFLQVYGASKGHHALTGQLKLLI